MNVVLLSLKIFFRELKSGQLLLMFLSLTLAVGIVASITLFTDRLDRSLICLLYTSPSPRDSDQSRMPSSA